MKRKSILFLASSIFIITASILMLLILNWRDVFDPMPHSLRKVAETKNFEGIWRNDDIFIGGKTSRANRGFLQVESDSVFSLVVFRNLLGQEWTLRKQQLDNGNIQWEKDLLNSVEAVQMNDQEIFVVTSELTTCGLEWRPECESIIITAYETIDGKEIWTNTYEGLLNIEFVETDDSTIVIHGNANRGNRRATYIIDMRDGELLQSTEAQRGLREIEELMKPDPVPEDLRFSPLSNLFEQDEILFFVSEEGRLLAVREETQTIIGSVQFLPTDSYVAPTDITVTGGKSIVIIYFEDSRQLFAFRFLADE